jgi:hypothetical protein
MQKQDARSLRFDLAQVRTTPLWLWLPDSGQDTLHPFHGQAIRMQTIRIERNRAHSALMFAGSLMFVALGVWLVQVEPRDPNDSVLMMRLAGAASVLFFGATLVGWGSNVVRWSPALVLAPEGLRINVGLAGRAAIPWEDIVELHLGGGGGPSFLVVELRDPVAHAQRAGPLRNALDRANLKLCGSPVAIAAQALRGDAREIRDNCNEWLARWRTERGAG